MAHFWWEDSLVCTGFGVANGPQFPLQDSMVEMFLFKPSLETVMMPSGSEPAMRACIGCTGDKWSILVAGTGFPQIRSGRFRKTGKAPCGWQPIRAWITFAILRFFRCQSPPWEDLKLKTCLQRQKGHCGSVRREGCSAGERVILVSVRVAAICGENRWRRFSKIAAAVCGLAWTIRLI